MKQNSRAIGVGVVGCGRAGMIHARNFASAVSGAQLVAMADPVSESLERSCSELRGAKGYADYRAMLEDKAVDAIVIATPTALHKEIAVAAAGAGKHILCEKPLAMNPLECMEIIKAVEKNSVTLSMGFMRRYDESFVEAKARIDQGEIGDVILVKSLTHGPSVPQRWMYDLKISNGPLAEVNSHDIDTLRWFTGSEFKKVYAIGGNYRCKDIQHEFPDFYDNVIVSASFENDMQGFISGALSAKYGYDARVEILGTTGILFIGHLDSTSVMSCTNNGITRPIVKSWRDLFANAYLSEDKDFVQCILEGRKPKASGLDGKKAVEIVNASNDSIRTGMPVVLQN